MMNYVMLVTRGCPCEKYPGNGIFEFDQAKALAKAGCKVVYAAVDMRSIRRWRKWGINHFVKDEVSVYIINIPLGRVPHTVLSYCGKIGLIKLFNIIKEEQGDPDIIHAHFFVMAEIALSLKGKTAAKFVMTEHTGVLTIPKWSLNAAPFVYTSYDKTIAVSSGQRFLDGLEARKHQNCTVIPNMLDPLFLERDIKPASIETFDFIFIGMLIEGKGPIESILAFNEAFKNLVFRTPNNKKIRLRIIGGGPLFKRCKIIINKCGIPENVQLLGQMSHKDIIEEISNASCFVLPSQIETFGVSYIEAMSCGLPVIATKCGGPESFVSSENGILIPVNDIDALVNAFRYMSLNIDKYDRQLISAHTRNKFSPTSITTQLLSVYKDLCNGHTKYNRTEK